MSRCEPDIEDRDDVPPRVVVAAGAGPAGVRRPLHQLGLALHGRTRSSSPLGRVRDTAGFAGPATV
ncbi:MAG TPA: hypothetical protein VH092_22075 [Urbifossiella sp.]|nr:hypothetical protein [Urbifossiella sp.]